MPRVWELSSSVLDSAVLASRVAIVRDLASMMRRGGPYLETSRLDCVISTSPKDPEREVLVPKGLKISHANTKLVSRNF
jgi:hypothetical protein